MITLSLYERHPPNSNIKKSRRDLSKCRHPGWGPSGVGRLMTITVKQLTQRLNTIKQGGEFRYHWGAFCWEYSTSRRHELPLWVPALVENV